LGVLGWFVQQPDQVDLRKKLDTKSKRFIGYFNIARHYKWALDQVFTVMNFTSAIIVEGLFVCGDHSMEIV